jgi:hypothetical protein
MASERFQKAADSARDSKPRIEVSVFTHGGAGPDKSWIKEEKKRAKDELKRLSTEIDKFDRDKAADKVLSALMRERKRVESRLEDYDESYGGTYL